ncbi:pirin family protein [Aquimarina sp. W85]|uniref:pirin family protein n=1 Tax=Aquimarina rhodophyticola TaxID=3342246 RepID=UPI00366F33BA
MKAIKSIKPLGLTWETSDPFLFCAYHEDTYPPGNEKLGPKTSLDGRNLGHDFVAKDGYRMYHGTTIPGFPAHPHRGFETVTIVQKGLVDHADSLGAAGRFGDGDVQWMTAGSGVQHSEMFPLLNKNASNPFLLFQIWLNLPKRSKYVAPHFKMLWQEDIPILKRQDTKGRTTTIKLIAGTLDKINAPQSAPDSWASDPANNVAIWILTMEPNATFILPPTNPSSSRSLYFYNGDNISTEGYTIPTGHRIILDSSVPFTLTNGNTISHFLLLQGNPIKEPIVQQGPFVMNTRTEIAETIATYQKTEFGGWPWPTFEYVHAAHKGRFALYPDGSLIEKQR